MGSQVSAMVLKTLIVMVMVGVAMSESKCDPDKRDCSCSDKSFAECVEPAAVANEVHAATRELCIANCDLFNSIGSCDWFIRKGDTTDTNCVMYTMESMAEYLGTCNIINFPLFRPDDTCMVPDDGGFPCLGCSGAGHGACQACQATECDNIFHETECSVTSVSESTTSPEQNTIDACLFTCISASADSDVSYAGYNLQDNVCDCYEGGERICEYEVIAALATNAQVEKCKGGANPDPTAPPPPTPKPGCLNDGAPDCPDPSTPLCNPDTGVCMAGCRAHGDCANPLQYCDCGDSGHGGADQAVP